MHPGLTSSYYAALAARSHEAGTLRESDVDTTVDLCGWVDNVRNFGPVIFFTVRDHTGIVQVLWIPDPAP